ncbi:peptidase family M48-domain-containing protein [Phlyctochytrium arcticum]|nr:peptidase family M48-domain-containing protein [Phlyctochytrium arcticum]
MYNSHLESVPITGRKRFVDVSPKQERAMAEMAFGQVIAQYRGQILPSWHPYSKFVREIADRLITVTPGVRNRDWDVYVIDDPQKNAFVLPDGKIFVFTGLLPIVRDADGMAAVLGHEMAHQIARHAAEKLSWTKISVIAQLVIATVFDPGMLLSRIFLEYGILMPFSRKMESEADYIGLILMAQACYNPEAAIGMWQRMAAADRQKVPQYLSTHPSSDQRIEKIREWMPEALKARAASDCLTVSI